MPPQFWDMGSGSGSRLSEQRNPGSTTYVTFIHRAATMAGPQGSSMAQALYLVFRYLLDLLNEDFVHFGRANPLKAGERHAYQ
jgi:hypothetical protein